MIPTPSMFSTDPGKIFDFSKKRPADIFNESIIPRLSSLDSDMGLDEAAQRRQQQLNVDLQFESAKRQEDDAFLSELTQRRQQPFQQPSAANLDEYAVDIPEYDRPVTPPSAAPSDEPLGARVVDMPASKDLVGFVKHFEGFNPKAYGDFKQTSIGYGTRARKGETTISKQEAEKRLSEELALARRQVDQYDQKYGYKFTDNEKDALTSFAYNVGNIRQLTDNGKRDKATIAAKILEYNKAGGKVLKGLAKRRQAEHNLFVKGY